MRFGLGMSCATAVAPCAAAAGVADAAGWSTPAVLEPGCGKITTNCASETAPRVAVNARGQSVVAWVGAMQRVEVATGEARGRFSRSVRFEKAFRPAVTIAADGTVVVVWSRDGLLRYVRRAPGHGFSRPAVLVARSSRYGDDMAKAAIQPNGSTLVVYETASRTPTQGDRTGLPSEPVSRGGRPGE